MVSVSSVSLAANRDFCDKLRLFVEQPNQIIISQVKSIRAIDQPSVDRALVQYSDGMLVSAVSFLMIRLKVPNLSKAEKQRLKLIRKYISKCLKNRQALNVTLEVETRTEAFRVVADDRGLGLGWKLVCAVSFAAVVVILGAYFIIDRHKKQ